MNTQQQVDDIRREFGGDWAITHYEDGRCRAVRRKDPSDRQLKDGWEVTILSDDVVALRARLGEQRDREQDSVGS